MERPELEKILVLLEEFRTAKEDAHTYFIQAFECLMDAYTKRVVTVCRLRGVVEEGDQRDIAQEVFISIYKSLSSFQGDSAVRLHSWILAIINNRIHDFFRKRPKLEQLDDLSGLLSRQTSEVESQIMARSEGEIAMLALTRLW
jgi:RNA polymerase sigma-70 factor (ECF subfamily)